MNPTDCVKAAIGWTTYNLLNLIKQNVPEFVHGMNCHDLADYFSRHIQDTGDQTAFVSFDGSKYDAH